jgi:hypothetical protein
MRQAMILLVPFFVISSLSVAAEPKADAGKGSSGEQMTYTAPAGWEKSEQERMTIFTPPDVPPTKAALIVTQGQNLDGDFVKWFRGKWDALRKGDEVVQGGERTGQDGPNGSSVLYQAALLEGLGAGGTRKQTGLLLYAVHIGTGVHWVVFRTDGPEPFNKYKKTVNKFLAGLKFVESVPAEATAKDKRQGKPKDTDGDKSAPAPNVKPKRGLRVDE